MGRIPNQSITPGVAVLIAAVKEQQQVFESQNTKLAQISAKINRLEFKLILYRIFTAQLNHYKSGMRSNMTRSSIWELINPITNQNPRR